MQDTNISPDVRANGHPDIESHAAARHPAAARATIEAMDRFRSARPGDTEREAAKLELVRHILAWEGSQLVTWDWTPGFAAEKGVIGTTGIKHGDAVYVVVNDRPDAGAKGGGARLVVMDTSDMIDLDMAGPACPASSAPVVHREPRAEDEDDISFYSHPGVGPVRSYLVTCRSRPISVHEGPGLAVAAIAEADEGGRGTYSEVVWEGSRAIAVITRSVSGDTVVYLDGTPSAVEKVPFQPLRREFTVTVAAFEQSSECSAERSSDDVIAEEVQDLSRCRDMNVAEGVDPSAWAAREDDRAVWQDDQLVATIRPTSEGPMEVTRFTPRARNGGPWSGRTRGATPVAG